MNKILICSLFLSGAFSLSFAAGFAPEVSVDGGIVRGTMKDGLAVYKGIPYAAPPVGAQRWKPPQKVVPWKGVWMADRFRAACPQPRIGNTGPMDNRVGELSEDCLYLNVIAPKGENLPVMVWIHGGGFAIGWPGITNYSGENLARKGVVFVSIAYRLGVFGFLAHPELSAECPFGASGNYGIMDQIAALKWVKNHIAKFGGDPGNITIFGESAGGISVATLCASPLAKGLFRRAISQSGGAMTPADVIQPDGGGMRSLRRAEREGIAFAARMGVKSIAELRKIPAEKLLDDPSSAMGGFWTCQDGLVIAGDPRTLYRRGEFNDVDVLIGTNSNEGAMFYPERHDPVRYRASLEKRFGKLSPEALKVYPADNEQIAARSARNVFRDTVFAWPSWTWATLQSEKGKSKVYVYYFDQSQPIRSDGVKIAGASHGDEINYVFGHVGKNFNYQYTGDDRKLSEMMMTAWVNFAKTGNPEAPGLPGWPRYRNGKNTVMHFRNFGAELGPQPNLPQLEFLSRYTDSPRTR